MNINITWSTPKIELQFNGTLYLNAKIPTSLLSTTFLKFILSILYHQASDAFDNKYPFYQVKNLNNSDTHFAIIT